MRYWSLTLVAIGGGFLFLLALLPVDMEYEGKLVLAVLGITFMVFAVIGSIISDMWR